MGTVEIILYIDANSTMQPETNLQETEQHLFTDEDLFQYQDASTGQRFLNFLIDNLLMRFGISYLTGTFIGYILGSFFPNFAFELFNSPTNGDLVMLGIIIAYFNYMVYYIFCEKFFKGYTLGKLITGTRAIRNDGQELSFKDVILRTLSRIVPFEVFSGIGGNPWHDQWTKTMVVKTR